MKSKTFIVTTLIALALLMGACAPAAMPAPQPPAQVPPTQAPAATAASSGGSSSSGGGGSAAVTTDTPAATSAMASGPATVNVGTNSKYKAFLVDGKGMTLYLFTKDTPGTSTCYDKCATFWPPLLTSGTPVAGTGVDASKFGTAKRTDGTMQVTYNGWPLYYFEKDKQAGDITGDGAQNVWYLVTPSGDKAVSGG